MDKKNHQKKPSQSAAERQKALDDIPLEDLEKVKAHQASTEGGYKVDNEWLILAEVADRWGWQAFLDIKNDARDENGNLLITMAEVLTLLEASRKLDYKKMFDNTQASFIASISAQSKKPSSTFSKLIKHITRKTKVDEE